MGGCLAHGAIRGQRGPITLPQDNVRITGCIKVGENAGTSLKAVDMSAMTCRFFVRLLGSRKLFLPKWSRLVIRVRRAQLSLRPF